MENISKNTSKESGIICVFRPSNSFVFSNFSLKGKPGRTLSMVNTIVESGSVNERDRVAATSFWGNKRKAKTINAAIKKRI